jgi:hypothetical protein
MKTQSIAEKDFENLTFLGDNVIRDKVWKTKVLNILIRSHLITSEEARDLKNLTK